MKLIRFGNLESENPGVFLGGKRKDLALYFTDWDRPFFRQGGIQKLEALLQNNTDLADVADDVRWASPIARPGKVLCIGLNYSNHAKESGMAIPAEPILFQKGANTVV